MTVFSGLGSKIALIGLAGAGLFLGGCRWEKAAGPSPTPTPAPNPTPTPNPTPQPSPTPNPTPFFDNDTASALTASFVHQVAYANASLVEKASREAAQAAGDLREALRGAAASDSGSVPAAEAALAAAREAFFSAEAALYYYAAEEDAPEGFEGLRPSVPDLDPPAFAAVSRLLEAYAAEPVNPSILPSPRTLLGQDLSLAAQDLETQLSAWSDLWQESAGFRQKVFLSDADAAAGRIFQGVVAVLDLVVEETGNPAPEARRLLGRLQGAQSLWTGIYRSSEGDSNFGSGLAALVASVSPDEAAAISESLAALTVENWEGDQAAVSAGLRAQLIRAAGALGFSVEENRDRGGLAPGL